MFVVYAQKNYSLTHCAETFAVDRYPAIVNGMSVEMKVDTKSFPALQNCGTREALYLLCTWRVLEAECLVLKLRYCVKS